MGGCKCTYRNCNVKTDGKTHMFHYPVFEKLRCHQWLINAHRLDFLDLKVSQLKNRVVCQNHFKDDNFMNFKKDKLTFDAIPTEDGPYCDPTNYVDCTPDSSKLYSILVDDIENDLSGCDKKANYSLKYGDFLTLDYAYLGNNNEANISYKQNNSVNNLPLDTSNKDNVIDESGVFYRLSLTEKSKKAQNQPMLVVPPYVNSNNISQDDSINYLKCDNNVSLNFTKDSSIGQPNIKNNASPEKQVKKPSKIRIISEKKITEPVPITGKFEPVCPNFVLNAPKAKKEKINTNQNYSTENVTEVVNAPSLDNTKKIEIEIGPIIKEEDDKSQPTFLVNEVQDNNVVEKLTKMSSSHSRMPPERVEAINKKRKFNMKLREVIESCLDKLENSDKRTSSPELVYKPRKVNKSIRSHLNESPVSSNQDSTIQYLEARMRKMEDVLLEKIEQNSKKIVDLKNTCIKATAEKKSLTSAKNDEEAHKRQLFQEISKYLSPSSKSLVYEELFINKFAISESTTTVKRKRGRRGS